MNYNLVSYKSENNTLSLRFEKYEDARNAWMDIDRLIILGKNYMMGILSMTKPTTPRDGFFDFGIEFTSKYSWALFFARNIRCYKGQLCLQLPDIMIKEHNDNIDKVIKDIQFNPKKGAVTILWENGDVTVAKKGKNDIWDPEKGLMMAFGQHFFGSKTQFNNWRKKVLEEGGMNEDPKEPDISYVDSTTYEPKHVKKRDQLLDMFDPQTGRVYKMSPEFIKDFAGFAEFCKNIANKSSDNDEDDDDPDEDIDTRVSEALL